jgi:hypothetical protein
MALAQRSAEKTASYVGDATATAKKINSTEEENLPHNYDDRLAKYKIAKEAVTATNAFGNMSEMLSALGIHSSNKAGYNTQFGLVLNQQNPVEIGPPTQRLLASEEQVLLDSPSLASTLQADFELDMEGLDMVFFVMPDAAPVQVVETVLAAKAPTTTASSKVRKMTYGICNLFYANEGNLPPYNPVGIVPFMIDFLSPEIQKALDTRFPGGGPGVDWDWYAEWENSLKVTILRAPKHGKVNHIDGTGYPSYTYLPDEGYLGKDRLDLLVEGKDDLGRPIAMTFRYYINVLSEKEKRTMVDTGTYYQVAQKYCGTTKKSWRISQPTSNDYTDPVSWYRATSLYALLSGAKDALSGFADLSGAAIGQTTGDKITLDTNAAGYDWYIDYTPYLNEEYLPLRMEGGTGERSRRQDGFALGLAARIRPCPGHGAQRGQPRRDGIHFATRHAAATKCGSLGDSQDDFNN